ncbi:recombinase family protein [Anaeromicrobium sediminis]|uniref:Resolvase n=1 Tax=Anaeromicrobium sediminis TaxID=1478221 RepID=A0A267MQF1_9FIRM|nr:recombinase family protein [Anaeromicrobium sediminis]PAB61003.1 resolvase [Anaeromicrobium sediminis]
MIYGYARVSTTGQMKDGNSLEHQEKRLIDAGAKEIIKEGYTGTTSNRPQFQELLSKLKEGDTLVVTKLDRFARSTIQGATIVQNLIDKGIKVNILNMGVLDNTPGSKLIRNIFFAFAEYERDMIVERTQEGKAVARTKDGFKEGRPKKYTIEQLDHAMELLNKHSYTQVEKMTKISKATLVREKRKRKKLE